MRSGFAVDAWHLLGTDASDRGSDDNGGGGESGDGERMVPAETALEWCGNAPFLRPCRPCRPSGPSQKLGF
jgi:hypothetical protein